MSTRPIDHGTLERLRYWQGQALASRDFRDQAALDARRRRYHALALHRVPGIAFGLRVTLEPAASGQAAPTVIVECGLAYDGGGRELVLEAPRTLMAPDGVAEGASVRLLARATDSGVELTWGGARTGPCEAVPLARLSREGGALRLDPAFRPPIARAEARPRLATGASVAGGTPWEPWLVEERDAQGALQARVVGVQTRIDTSAAGFTSRPVYLASLQGPTWDLSQAAFAPTWLAHIAEPSVDGFTLRLLMEGIARRSHPLAEVRPKRASALLRRPDGRVQVTLASLTSGQADTTPLSVGDAVAALRPRGDAVVAIQGVEQGNEITLTLDPGLTDLAAGARLAIGHLPRVAQVQSAELQRTLLVEAAAPEGLAVGDVLVRVDAGQATVVATVAAMNPAVRSVRLALVAEGLVSGERLRVASTKGASSVGSATAHAGGQVLRVALKKKAGLRSDDLVVRLPSKRRGAPEVARVLEAREERVDLEALPGGLDGKDKLATVGAAELRVDALGAALAHLTVKLAAADLPRFRVGDFVARADASGTCAVIEAIDPQAGTLTLAGNVDAGQGQWIAAADLARAVVVTGVDPAPNDRTVHLSQREAVPAGACVARVLNGGTFPDPVSVAAAGDATATLAAPLAGLKALDTLVVGEFPRVARVAELLADAATRRLVRVEPADALRARDRVVVLDASPGARPVVDVVWSAGGWVELSHFPEGLAAGQRLGRVSFHDTVEVAALVNPGTGGQPVTLEVDRLIEARTGDVAAALAGYVDNSPAAVVESVSADHQTIVLGPPEFTSGPAADGIVADGLIDGGLLGLAGLRIDSTGFQLKLRPASLEGLSLFSQVTVSGLDLLRGVYRSVPMLVLRVDANGQIWVAGWDNYLFRPEELSMVGVFNADFPTGFAAFAHKQRLYVSWVGCEEVNPPPEGCPGTPPAGASSACGCGGQRSEP
jgi:hypothetical protein